MEMLLQPIGRFRYTDKYSEPLYHNSNNCPKAKNVVFCNTQTSAGKPLMKLSEIPCALFGITTLNLKKIKKIKRSLQGCEGARQAVIYLRPYADKNMLKTEKRMLERFSDDATYSRRLGFPNLLKSWYKDALIQLQQEEIDVIEQIEQIALHMSPETTEAILAETAECKRIIENEDPNHRFKRKDVLDALSNINPMPGEEEIMEDLIDMANYLPNSITSENAFIVKYADRSHEEISNRLVRPSLKTVEHLWAKFRKGPNDISNFVVACEGANSLKGDAWLKRFARRFPEVIPNSQAYADFFINAINNGRLKGNQSYPYKIKARYIEQSDGLIQLDLSQMKYSEEEAYAQEQAYKIDKAEQKRLAHEKYSNR